MPQQKIIESQQMVDDLFFSCLDGLKRRLNDMKKQTDFISRNILLLSPDKTLHQKIQSLRNINDKLRTTMDYSMEKTITRVDQLNANLNSLSPLNVLDRGYSLTRKLPEKILVTHINQLAKNDTVEILLGDGLAHCRVINTFPGRQS